jgi:SSS family solute:Na+ symporter
MTFHPIDLTIIAVYMLITLALGFFVRHRAMRKLESYFLADRSIRWWMLGLSGCSSYIDIGGTMVIIGMMFYVGLKSVWVTHVFWGFFMMAFYMAFQAKYIRRSGVMTLAEWNETRFGQTTEAEHVRLATATFLLILMVFNLIYLAVGTGKFAEEFLPFSRGTSTFLVFAVVGIYVTVGGFFGVVLTDIFQTTLIAVGTLVLTVMVFQIPETANFLAIKDPAWSTLAPTWTLWSSYLPQTPESHQHYYWFGPIMLAGLSWLVFKILAGPVVWDFTFFLTTKNPREASLAAGMWTVGHTLRWFLAGSFLFLGIYYLGSSADFDAEKIMPLVLKRLPVGLSGLFMAVLLAALMSTISAMVNVTSSVILNDFLKRYFAKNLPEKQLIRLGMAASIITVSLAFSFSFLYDKIISIWELMIFVILTMILLPGTMRWHWWRFGSRAFVWSMVGTGCIALAQKLLFPEWPVHISIPVNVIVSFVLTVIITFLSKPADTELLVKFYAKVRPFGFWKPIRLEAERRGLVPINDKMPSVDLMNGFIASLFQLTLGIIPFYMFLRNWNQVFIWSGICVVVMIVLYFTWYKNLPSPDEP